jgi:hypothetical protein
MKIVLSIPIEQYDPFLNKTKTNSREYILLRNSIIKRDQQVVEVPCEMETAKQLLEFARMLHPEAAASIEESIRILQVI